MRTDKPSSIVTEIILILTSCLFLYPILYLVLGSFKEPKDFYNPFVFPKSLYLAYYVKVFDKINIGQAFSNTVIITACSLALTIIVASMAGYVLARMDQKIFRYSYLYLLSGMIVPLIGALIPLFKLGIALHLMNTRTFLVILYTAGQIPFASFLFAAFTKGIPRELEESANMDGCGRFRLFWTIIFPLLLPATGTFVITNVYGIWNDFLTPLIFLNDPHKLTLMPQIVQFMFNNQSIDFGPVFAVSVLAVLPLIVLFLFTQKYMLRGLVIGSVKG